MHYSTQSLRQLRQYYYSAVGEMAEDLMEAMDTINKLERENSILEREVKELEREVARLERS